MGKSNLPRKRFTLSNKQLMVNLIFLSNIVIQYSIAYFNCRPIAINGLIQLESDLKSKVNKAKRLILAFKITTMFELLLFKAGVDCSTPGISAPFFFTGLGF